MFAAARGLGCPDYCKKIYHSEIIILPTHPVSGGRCKEQFTRRNNLTSQMVGSRLFKTWSTLGPVGCLTQKGDRNMYAKHKLVATALTLTLAMGLALPTPAAADKKVKNAVGGAVVGAGVGYIVGGKKGATGGAVVGAIAGARK